LALIRRCSENIDKIEEKNLGSFLKFEWRNPRLSGKSVIVTVESEKEDTQINAAEDPETFLISAPSKASIHGIYKCHL
jgi:hypothetical protein